jgi:hypothetical protein
MKHGISELDWNDYLDRCAPQEVCDHIETHLIGCLECWEFYERMSSATQDLHDAAEDARARVTIEDRQLHRMLSGVFAQARAAAEPNPDLHPQVKGRLSRLETVLAPFCGPRAAVCALQAAARNSPAASLDQVTLDNWAAFLENLTAIAAAMCGETFAGLVRESGQY